MLWIAFGRWSSASGALFTRERLYGRKGQWTPLVKVSFRYLATARQRGERTCNATAACGQTKIHSVCEQVAPVEITDRMTFAAALGYLQAGHRVRHAGMAPGASLVMQDGLIYVRFNDPECITPWGPPPGMRDLLREDYQLGS
jgi:hypothetical protein